MIKNMQELINLLNNASDAYYNTGQPIMTDDEWDKMFDELTELENSVGVVYSNSPTRNVGYEVKSKLDKVTHSHPMLSLDKTKNIYDLVKFSSSNNCVMSLKMDGLTILLTYEDGLLVRAETRGNGEIGEDVTHCVKMFDNVPLTISRKGHCEFEGEAIITYQDFDEINSHLPDGEKYKNPRNLVSGSVRQLDNSIAAQRHMKFVLWKVPYIENSYMKDNFILAKNLGFTIVPHIVMLKDSDQNIFNLAIKHMKEAAVTLGYPIDGMVLSYDDISYGLSLGMTGHHPRHSIAYKFSDELYETTLRDIEWNTSKTGQINPVAIFDEVDLDGAITSRATLHNVSYIKDLELGIGDIIQIYRANMVIPKVHENLTRSNTFKIPNKCPICGGEARIKKDNNSEVLFCTNPDCKGKLLSKLTHAVSKNALDIDGLSEETLNVLINMKYVDSIASLYWLSDYKRDLTSLDGFGSTKVSKLLKAIEKSKDTNLERLIYAQSIPLIGRTASKQITSKCSTFEELDKYILASKMPFSEIEGFGEVMSRSVLNWWMKHREEFLELYNMMHVNKEETQSDNSLQGMIFVITGSLVKYKNRDELVKIIESHGGKVSGSVSTKTAYLINNDTESNSSKNVKAKSLNIPIINEDDFVNKVLKTKK